MFKLIGWFTAVLSFFAVWAALIYHSLTYEISHEYRCVLYLFPLIAVMCFGIYSASVVLWRVYNFNDCLKETVELQKEIKDARADLITKGFVFQ